MAGNQARSDGWPRSGRRLAAGLAAGLAAAILAAAGAGGNAGAQTGQIDLKVAPPSARVTQAQYCAAAQEFRFTLADGSRRVASEYAVSLKVDSTPQGPPADTPVWMPARGPGDRILVVFASLEALQRMIVPGC